MPELEVPFGAGRSVLLKLPDAWVVDKTCVPRPVPACAEPAEAARKAVAAPHGAPPLAELAKKAKSVVAIVDDVSRPTPVHAFFDAVMEIVEGAGVEPERITVLTALGVHRPMTAEEIAGKIGARGAQRYRCENHDSEPGDHLVYLGVTSQGSPVWVHRLVAEADLVLSFGCIEPHTIAGFGGGYKNVFPGTAGKETIAANHRLNTTKATFNMVGSQPADNPMRRDLEECGRMLKATVFIINAVLDGSQRVAKITAGDPVAAHREGIKTSEKIFGVPIDAPADVLITSSNPMNIDLRQGLKAVANTIKAVRPGGVMINLVAAEQGLGDMTMPSRDLYVGKRAMRALAYALLPFFGRSTFGMKEEDLYFVYFALQAFKRNDIYFYSPNVPAEFSRRMPFFEIHADTDALIRRAARSAPRRARVLVFPLGGVTYPILSR